MSKFFHGIVIAADSLLVIAVTIWSLSFVSAKLGHPIRPLDQAINLVQFGGSAVVTGTGTGGSGIPRVTLSNDSSLAAHQSINLDQVGGVGVVSPLPVSFSPTSGSGATSMAQRDLGAKVSIKGSAGTVFSIWAINTQAALPTWVACFDSATTGGVTLGTTSPTIEFEVFAGGQVQPTSLAPGQNFALGIICAATTTERGATPSASGVQFFGTFL